MLKRSGAYTLITLGVTLAAMLAGAAGMTLYAHFSTGGVGNITVVEGNARQLPPFSFSSGAQALSFPLLERYDVNACVSFWDDTDTNRTEKPEVYQARKADMRFLSGLYGPYEGVEKAARLIVELAGGSSGGQVDANIAELELALADSVQIDRDAQLLYLQDFTIWVDGAAYAVDLVCNLTDPASPGRADGKFQGGFYFKCSPKTREQGEQPSAMWKQLRFSQLCDEFYRDMKAGETFKLDSTKPNFGIDEKIKAEENPLSAFFLVFHSNFSDMLERVTSGQLQATQSKILREPARAVVAGEELHYYVQQWEESEATLVLMYDPVAQRVEGVSVS